MCTPVRVTALKSTLITGKHRSDCFQKQQAWKLREKTVSQDFVCFGGMIRSETRSHSEAQAGLTHLVSQAGLEYIITILFQLLKF